MAQLVAHDLAKVGVAGPNPVYRSQTLRIREVDSSRQFHMMESDKIGPVVRIPHPQLIKNIAGCMKLVSGESHKLVRKPRRFESSSRNTIEVYHRIYKKNKFWGLV